jgi:hypothetical protein
VWGWRVVEDSEEGGIGREDIEARGDAEEVDGEVAYRGSWSEYE